VAAFIHAIENGAASPISYESIYDTTITTFKILDAITTGLPQDV
jgi:hypothetical protein